MGYLVNKLIDKRIAQYQNDLITTHCDEVQNIYKEMRGWRHDYHNHIQTMKAYVALGQTEKLNAYLDRLDADLTSVDTVVKTGNIMVDAILNSKLSLAKSRGILVNVKATVPENIPVSDIDLCVIIGNLLDNAIEACMKVENPTGRFIRVYIGVKCRGADHSPVALYLVITNAASKKVKNDGNRFITAKEGFHGFGLLRVDRICEKYSGYATRASEEGVFTSEILLPL